MKQSSSLVKASSMPLEVQRCSFHLSRRDPTAPARPLLPSDEVEQTVSIPPLQYRTTSMFREIRTVSQIEDMLLQQMRATRHCEEVQAVHIARCQTDIGPNWRLASFNPGGSVVTDSSQILIKLARALGRRYDVGDKPTTGPAVAAPIADSLASTVFATQGAAGV
jgi:hypothetical protein